MVRELFMIVLWKIKIANQSLQPIAARWAAPAELFVRIDLGKNIR